MILKWYSEWKKDIQYNDQKKKKKDERTRNDLYVQNTTMKTKDSANPTKTRKG